MYLNIAMQACISCVRGALAVRCRLHLADRPPSGVDAICLKHVLDWSAWWFVLAIQARQGNAGQPVHIALCLLCDKHAANNMIGAVGG